MDPADPTTWPRSARRFHGARCPPPRSSPLLEVLLRRIRAEGPLSFDAFMEAALYHPEHGYYRQPRSPLGPAGDYVTAPEHHPAFGRLVGRRLRQVWEGLGHPARFTVVEQGAGSGALAEGVLAELEEAQVRYRVIEPFASWRSRQAARLARRAAQVEWVESVQECPSFTGVFVSNELVDAFPAHRVVVRRGALRELWVAAGDGVLVEEEGPLSTPGLRCAFDRAGLLPLEGVRAAVCLRLEPWAEAVCARIERGSFLTIDYGGTAAELYGTTGRADVRACRRHLPAELLAAPGEQDLTAPVDFTALIRAGKRAGLTLSAFTTQRDFLLAMGWEKWRARAGVSRRALTDLIDPRLMGGARVVELERP